MYLSMFLVCLSLCVSSNLQYFITFWWDSGIKFTEPAAQASHLSSDETRPNKSAARCDFPRVGAPT